MRVLTRDELLRLRCSEHDWAIWQSRARTDEVWRQTATHRRRVDQAREAFAAFVSGDRGYIGVSWGKDSCAVLALALELGCDWPLVHVKLEPVGNPDCDILRDHWFDRFPELRERYYEVVIRCQVKLSTNRYDTNAAYEAGFATARKKFGKRRISGVRAEEAAIRKMTMRRLGQGDEDATSARPIGWWRSEDVYAHLLDYPLHPAYPCAMNGAYERGRVRVNNLWGLYAEEFGRREHEARYYRDAIRRIEAQHARDVETPPSFDECLPRLIFPPWKQQ